MTRKELLLSRKQFIILGLGCLASMVLEKDSEQLPFGTVPVARAAESPVGATLEIEQNELFFYSPTIVNILTQGCTTDMQLIIRKSNGKIIQASHLDASCPTLPVHLPGDRGADSTYQIQLTSLGDPMRVLTEIKKTVGPQTINPVIVTNEHGRPLSRSNPSSPTGLDTPAVSIVFVPPGRGKDSNPAFELFMLVDQNGKADVTIPYLISLIQQNYSGYIGASFGGYETTWSPRTITSEGNSGIPWGTETSRDNLVLREPRPKDQQFRPILYDPYSHVMSAINSGLLSYQDVLPPHVLVRARSGEWQPYTSLAAFSK